MHQISHLLLPTFTTPTNWKHHLPVLALPRGPVSVFSTVQSDPSFDPFGPEDGSDALPPPTKQARAGSHQPYAGSTVTAAARRCTECGTDSTPQWRQGPCGPQTLCNACGVRYGRLVRKLKGSPTASPGSPVASPFSAPAPRTAAAKPTASGKQQAEQAHYCKAAQYSPERYSVSRDSLGWVLGEARVSGSSGVKIGRSRLLAGEPILPCWPADVDGMA